MSTPASPSAIAHFLPTEALRAARELSRRYQGEEVFRRYVVRNVLVVLPTGFFIVIISGFCAGVVAKAVMQSTATPAPGWAVAVLLLLTLLTFFGGVTTQLYLLFFNLAKLAYRQAGLVVASKAVVPAVWVCLAVFVLAPLVLSVVLPPIAVPSLAQERTSVSVHRICLDGDAGEKLFLHYWWPDVNDSIREPVCTFKASAFGGVPIRSARAIPNRQTGIGAIVVIEFDEIAKPLIEKMSKENVGKLMAVVVGDRIASLSMISRPYSDNKLLISVRTEREAERIVAAVNPSPGDAKRR